MGVVDMAKAIAEMVAELPYHSAVAAIDIAKIIIRENNYVDVPESLNEAGD